MLCSISACFSLLLLFVLSTLTIADPIPHTDHSKLFLLSKLAFNFLDTNGDGKLSTAEMDAVRDFPVNGMMLGKTKQDVKRVSDSMDLNKNNYIEEAEFVQFDEWLPVFVNGRPKLPVHLRDLQRYGQGGNSIGYSQLDRNRDGVIDPKELTIAR